MKTVVRLTGLTIENFKNVKEGHISLKNNRKGYAASILGLYGQNGSGKTALIDVIDLLKAILCGQTIPHFFADYIHVDCEQADLSFDFEINIDEIVHNVSYSFSLKKEYDYVPQNTEINNNQEKKVRVSVVNEILRSPILSETGETRLGKLIDTNTEELFLPRLRVKQLVGAGKDVTTNLLVAKKMAFATSKSFIFSAEFLKYVREFVHEKRTNDDAVFYYKIIEALVNYGNHELFVINTANSGLISMNAQPIMFKYKEKNMGAVGGMALPLDKPVAIPNSTLKIANKVINNMNIVLEQLIPGLTISIKKLGAQLINGNEEGTLIQLMSCKNSREIELKYESEGIKKIVSILQLLIVVYNQPNITIAVDELDAGVFEYLLGEILRIISYKGKGQIIFTSHNLRPLETLDKGFIAFTTVNPENRYIRLSNVKENNNLRDFYYRDIMLNDQNEDVYDATNNSEIALAFREAGEMSGS